MFTTYNNLLRRASVFFNQALLFYYIGSSGLSAKSELGYLDPLVDI